MGQFPVCPWKSEWKIGCEIKKLLGIFTLKFLRPRKTILKINETFSLQNFDKYLQWPLKLCLENLGGTPFESTT